MSSINSLGKCPFCGGDAWFDCDETGTVRWIECKECHAQTRKVITITDAPVFNNTNEAEAFLLGAWERRVND